MQRQEPQEQAGLLQDAMLDRQLSLVVERVEELQLTMAGGQEVEQDMEASEEMVLSQFRVVVAEAVEAEVRVGQGKTQVPQQAVRLVSVEAEQVEMLEPVM